MESTANYKNHIITIERDPDPINPRRDYDLFGTFAAFHRRYDLGDKEHGLTVEDCQRIGASEDYISLPVYLYDHSGLAVSTSPFGCSWDSGQLGLIFISREQIRKEYGVSRISKKLERKVINILQNEIDIYNQYLQGDVWGYTIEKDSEEKDSSWGFFGADYCLEQAKIVVDHYSKQLGEQLNLF